MTDPLIRARIRLTRDTYGDPGSAWLITMATAHRQPVFSDPIFAGAVAALFIETLPRLGVEIDLYVLLPEHLHSVVQITTGNLIAAIQAFKSHSAKLWIAWGGEAPLWQRSFHDRGLRTASDYDAAVSYVFGNPVDAGLVSHWQAYSLIGGRLAGRD